MVLIVQPQKVGSTYGNERILSNRPPAAKQIVILRTVRPGLTPVGLPMLICGRMSNSYYAPGKQRATKVRALFARIARRYDLLNDLQSCGLHRIWKRRAIELAGVKPGSSVLDLCCGTGDLAFGLAQKGACVIGLDFSNEMLDRKSVV